LGPSYTEITSQSGCPGDSGGPVGGGGGPSGNRTPDRSYVTTDYAYTLCCSQSLFSSINISVLAFMFYPCLQKWRVK